ncbi:hypothetical protein P4H65_02645 [Paenibacillus chitinolyticus]|uniref:hypothetical protein n=1 Tax=Paenibacillus chitinolyticus TaxID=79263 RepID=UPI002DBEBFB5|nr:hypothetical protein [Paenibacillus chitinolyticus]MEC0244717.1 hypothetical protein [Paenibacillus chitinolyticus]
MIQEFVDLVEQLFPSISPYVKDRVNDAIKQFDTSGQKSDFFMFKSLDHLAQGDIFDNIPFFKIDPKTNELFDIRKKGILLSNTCDASRDEEILFAPLIRLDDITSVDINQIKKNLIYQFLYLPDKNLHEYCIDLSWINNLPRSLILKALQQEKISKIGSLNRMGYYLFLAKITVHLMRPEDSEVQSVRAAV